MSTFIIFHLIRSTPITPIIYVNLISLNDALYRSKTKIFIKDISFTWIIKGCTNEHPLGFLVVCFFVCLFSPYSEKTKPNKHKYENKYFHYINALKYAPIISSFKKVYFSVIK